MKNRVISAVFVFLLMLVGCKSDTSALQLNLQSISFTADITYYNENYSADCSIADNGELSAKLTSPENLAGLSLFYSGEECKISYNGIEINNAERFFPQSCSVDIINDILRDCEKINPKKENGNYKVSGDLNGKTYTLIAAPTGLPISLQVPDFGMNVLFNGVTVINSKNAEEV